MDSHLDETRLEARATRLTTTRHRPNEGRRRAGTTMRPRLVALMVVLPAVLATFVALGTHATTAQDGSDGAPPPNFKVAFIGDQGVGGEARDVLQLIKDEGAAMVLHLGDLGYGDEDREAAEAWHAQLNDVLGEDFPYFASIGNHDVDRWSTYEGFLLDRLDCIPGARCSGDYGMMAACGYQGLFFILSGAGTSPDEPDHEPHVDYLRDQLAADDSVWRICSWHKNQAAMQVGGKSDDVGWGPYEVCREGRAIIATAHEHSYSRTKTLTSVEGQTVDSAWPNPNELRVSAGSTFVFVSGLGGKSIRDQERCLPAEPPYGCNGEWASIYTESQEANYGVLFIDFHVDGDPRKARGYFKNIDGQMIDTFTVTSDLEPSGSSGDSSEAVTPGDNSGAVTPLPQPTDSPALRNEESSSTGGYLVPAVIAALVLMAIAMALAATLYVRRLARR